MTPKIIALYLPQYHSIPENDRWWGNGFTEWTNVKKAEPLFAWHIQPKKPLNGNYYNLLNKNTVEWQTKLANEYGVYGFCYFHYYFQGKKLLEKPAENLLRWKDIPQKFCFFWANRSWCRTWTAYDGTTWAVEDEKSSENNGMLIEQTYGGEDDWRKHFAYLLPFFQDNRYIKKDGKPIFFIYKVGDISRANEMFELWNRLAQENRLPGIHLVSVNEEADNVPAIEAIAHYGFHKATGMSGAGMKAFFRLKHGIGRLLNISKLKKAVWDYEKMWQLMLNVEPYGNVPNYPGAFVNYDDTPRQGANGTVMRGATPELFARYLKKQLERAENVYHSEYILLDAWNEWGEGNYLEPDEEWKYGYLQALKEAVDKS